MEPLSTFFRINPALLFQNVTTPRSQTSSSISSPSFADHQTGLKVYSESPASLTSAHQDNPLFEGFPVLPASKRKAAVSGDAHGTKNTAVPGDSPKLEEQLHHLLEVLQQALELHSADGLPDDVAPRLADELQAVARRLRDKERELPVERQLRAKVQLALTGAEATIRKLRATPRRRTSANGSGVDWRSNEAASSPTLAAHTNSRFSAGTTLVAEGNTRGGIERDSVCRQLLQSPSSSMSPLSWTGPSFVTGGTPMCVVDDASMASPKELPTDQNGSTCSQLASVAGSSHGQIKIPTGIPRLRQLTSTSSEAATSSSFHPPLYNWMKAVLASTTKQNQPMLLHGNGSVGSDAGTRGVEDGSEAQSPGMGGAVHDSLASVVRAALSNKRTPPLIYGSPLYRRIQRLLAEQRSPIPLRNTSAPGGVMQQSLYSVEPSPIGGRRRGWETGATAPASSRPVWDQEVDTDSASASNRSSDTSSSCTTPTMTMRDDIAALPFDSSVSPFGPTLRERYAARTNTVASATASIQYPSATAASAAFDATGLSGGLPRPAREPEREAAELVAELGLDLQLAPFTVENITNLEVLAHAERWIRGQFIAANKVLEANRERTLEDERCSGSAGCSNDLDSSAQAQVEMVIQTEPAYRLSAGEHVLQCSASTSAPSFSAAAVNPTPIWPPKPKGRAAPGGVRVQFADMPQEVGDCWDGTARDDTDADVCSLSRSDQSKRSPLALKHQSNTMKDGVPPRNDGAAGCGSGVVMWPRKRHTTSEFGGEPTRRGLFRFASARGGTAKCIPGKEVANPLRAAEGCGRGSSFGMPCPDIPEGAAPTHPRTLPGSDAARVGPPGSLAAEFPRAVGRSAHAWRSGTQPYSADCNSFGPLATPRDRRSEEVPPDVLFTPGTSSAAGSKAAASRHLSRAFPTASGGRSRADGPEIATPLSDARSGGSSMSFSGNNPSAGGTVVGPSMANGHVPPAPRGPQGSADSFTPRTDESAEITAEVIFTPGNAQLGAKGYTEKRMMVPFRLDSATRSECETEEGDGSAKTLSSISSVSIIGSEPANATDLGADAARRPARRSESQSAGGGLQQATGRKGGTSKPQLSKYLCSFLTTLLPCTNGSVAS